MVNTSTLLLPPLAQPRSPEFPPGVCTTTFTAPGPEIKPVVIVTFNCLLLTTVVLRVFPLMTTTEDETNWLPFTMSTAPCCTWAKSIVLGESEPISGLGLELPQIGFEVPQPARKNRASRAAGKNRTDLREGMEMLGMEMLLYLLGPTPALR